MTILEELQNQFDKLCNEQDALYQKDFEKVFEQLFKLDNSLTKNYSCTDDSNLIKEALEKAGFADNETFCKDFKRYNEIFVEGKKIQKLELKIALQDGKIQIPKRPEPKPNEWAFATPSIIIPKELRPVLDKVFEENICKENGLFSCFTDIPKEDENDDDFLMIDAYGVKCNGLQVYYRDLQKHGVISGMLNKPIFKKALLASLTEICTFIRENTDKPNKVRNHIREKIKWFDTLPVYGLIFQILILQGLISWFENVSLEKGDKGYKDAEMLGQWIMNILLKKEVSFCYFLWGDGDKKWLKPLCNYLLSTQAGQAIQKGVRARNNEQTAGEPQQKKPELPKPLPMRLKGNEAKSLRTLLIDKNQIEKNTEEETFLYWFGCGEYNEAIKPIIWTGTKQIARELLEGLYKSKDSSFADIEKIVPMCFIKDKKPMQLAKNKKVPSLESDVIAGFLATIKKD